MKIKALSTFTAFTGQMEVFNAGDEGELPDVIAQGYVEGGFAIAIEDVLGTLSGIEPTASTSLEPQPLILSDEDRARLPQLDHDGDGAPGGDTSGDVALYSTNGFTLTDLGGGWWTITGPELESPIKVRTKAKAEELFNQMVAEAAGVAADLGASEGHDGAPGGDTSDADEGAPAE